MTIAVRELSLRNASGAQPATVSFFAPERDGLAWKCRYEIAWPQEIWKSFAAGHDSVQSLVLALQKTGSDIYFSDYHASGALIWEKPGNG